MQSKVIFVIFILTYSAPKCQTTSSLSDITFQTSRCYSGNVLKGQISDIETKEGLSYSTIGIKGSKIFAITDSLGFFSLNIIDSNVNLPRLTLISNYINYEIKEITVDFYKCAFLEIGLVSKPGISCPGIDVSPNKEKTNKRKSK